jgi:hypothetical protein
MVLVEQVVLIQALTQAAALPEVPIFYKQLQVSADRPDTHGGRPPKGLVGVCLWLVIAFPFE